MGVLAVQMKQPAAGLPYFIAALDADPARRQYWLNYIDALLQAGKLEDAQQVLALARQHGLQGAEVEALGMRLEGSAQIAEQPNAKSQPSRDQYTGCPVCRGATHRSRSPRPVDDGALPVARFWLEGVGRNIQEDGAD